MNDAGQTVCLSMIVKDEASVIGRCLDSVLPLIDAWAIVDTGSTDGTQDVIRERLADLPGELTERPWVDFAHNRNEALDLARGRCDYVLLIDADETLEVDAGFRLPRLVADAYDVDVRYDSLAYVRRQLLRDTLRWRYVGVLHEHVHCDEPHSVDHLDGVQTIVRHDGARSRDPLTYRRDALVLERALLDEPGNARYAFYLAQSYRDAGDLEAALRAYRRRAEMGGWAEEAWFSLYQAAQIEERLERPWTQVMEAYLTAYQFNPERAGPLMRIGMHYQSAGEYAVSHLFLQRAMQIPAPGRDALFVERPLYDYLLPVEYAVAAYYVGDHAAAIRTNNELLRSGRLPPQAVDQVVVNRRYSLDALHPPPSDESAPRVRIVLVALESVTDLDEALESALGQEGVEFDVVVLDTGAAGDLEDGLPDDPRVRIVRRRAAGEGAAVASFVREECDPADVVVAVPSGHSLAGTGVAAEVAGAFRDPGCHLVYGPYQGADGRFAGGEPACDPGDLAKAAAARVGDAMMCFRASLAREASETAREALVAAAGFQGIRYLDRPLTVVLPKPERSRTRAVPVKPARSEVGADLPPTLARRAELPSISCLMLTRDRIGHAKRAIRCFTDQTYPDKQLVIVSEGDRWYRSALQRYVDELQVPNVKLVTVEPGVTLGALRNVSMDAADGDILCQWDDDDLTHPLRVATQVDGMLRAGARACFLTDHLQYLEEERLAFWIDWTLGGRATEELELFPGTVMLYKDPRFRYPESGPFARRGEDSVLVSQLFRSVPIARLPGMGHLYVYRYHGRNTFPAEHHYRISSCCSPTEVILEHAERIRQAMAYYPIPKPVAVHGSGGPVLHVS